MIAAHAQALAYTYCVAPLHDYTYCVLAYWTGHRAIPFTSPKGKCCMYMHNDTRCNELGMSNARAFELKPMKRKLAHL